MSLPLSPGYRASALRRIGEEHHDLLIIGGGVVGAGAALDASSRGLSVALVEAQDWAAGTSSRSSKLIHGGLRYLEHRDFVLVREALGERARLLRRLAPHLVQPVRFLVPLRHHLWERLYVGTGVALYDILGGARAVPRHRQLSRRSALREAPGLRPDALIGAIQYYDAQVDDARYTMMVVRTAAQHGALVASRARATGMLRSGDRVTGAQVRDLESGRDIEVRAQRVISATGVWTDEIHEAAGTAGSFSVRASKGVHLVVPRDRVDLRSGLVLRTEKSVLFVIPWGRHWIIGTTDTGWDLDKANPAASQSDVSYLLDHINAVLRVPLTRDDVGGVYTGLRPLLAGASAETARLSREHAVAEPVPGLFVVAGGKYTTYRVMAKDVVDTAVRDLGTEVAPSMTERLPILGAVGYQRLWADRQRIAGRAGLPVPRVEHLLRRYGSGITELLHLIKERPELGAPIPGARDYLRAEAVYAVSHEGALHLEDVITRRTRISIEERDRGLRAATDIALLMAPLLGWDENDVRHQVQHYAATVRAERVAENAPDDVEANAARLGAQAAGITRPTPPLPQH